MARIWKLEDAKTHFSPVMCDAEAEPPVITWHGQPVTAVNAVKGEVAKASTQASNALQALCSDFDFS